MNEVEELKAGEEEFQSLLQVPPQLLTFEKFASILEIT